MVPAPADSKSNTQIRSESQSGDYKPRTALLFEPALLEKTLPIAAGAFTPPPSAGPPTTATPAAVAVAATAGCDMQANGTAKPRPSSPAARQQQQQQQQQGSGSSADVEVLRRVTVANVTIEVVRQQTTIIYRLVNNRPVSSLTPDQREKVMAEIQRMRLSAPMGFARPSGRSAGVRPQQRAVNAGNPPRPSGSTAVRARPPPLTISASSPMLTGMSGTGRSRPTLPSIAPRQPTTPLASAPSSGQVTPRSVSAASGASALPLTPKTASASTPRLQHQHQGSLQSRPPSSGTPTQPELSALEKMYQSAYLKLISGPAEALRRLNPPIELSSIIDTSANVDVVSSESLLKILKALTKSQAKQLAFMYEREAGVGRNSLELGMRNIRPSPRNSQPSSREVSPSPDVESGAEQEGYLHTPTAGNGTYTQQKRKYIKTGKYSVKKRAKDSSDMAESPSLSSTPSRPPPLRKTPTSNYIHPELVRKGLRSLSERRRAPDQVSYETEISKRFREALAMDHRMVDEVDWRTPFSGTQDVIQRLLPYHIYQYPDAAIDAITSREEAKIEHSTEALSRRLQKLNERFNGMLTREGSDSYYSIDRMQLDHLQKDDFKQQKDRLKDLQLQRDISSLGSALGSAKDRTW